MRQKTINLRNQGSFDKKNSIFSPDPKSHTQVGSLSAKKRAKNSHAWAPLTSKDLPGLDNIVKEY
jgi:hypothetical protein